MQPDHQDMDQCVITNIKNLISTQLNPVLASASARKFTAGTQYTNKVECEYNRQLKRELEKFMIDN